MTLTKEDLDSIKNTLHTELQPLKSDVQELKSNFLILRKDVEELLTDIRGLREQIQQLAITLDNFVKMMTDYREEFIILKAEVDQMKKIIKEKLGVEIAVQK